MTVNYPGERKLPRYQCTTGIDNFHVPRCQSVSGHVIDELVTEKLLKALEPAALELSLLAADDLEQERRRLEENWQQRLERAKYQANRARRQYEVIEPENRLVARELERQWESALRDLHELEQEYARFLQAHPLTLSDDQRELIRTLSQNLPAVWRAPATTNCERQRIVRLLIDRVVVTVLGTTEQVEVALHWSGGFMSHHELLRPVRRYEQTADYERLRSRVGQLHEQGKSYAEIAAHLNREGFRPAKQAKEFDKSIVGRLFKNIRHDLPTVRKATSQPVLQENEWCANDLAVKLGIPRTTLQSWWKHGWVHISRKLPGYHGRVILWADAPELHRLLQLRQTERNNGGPLPKSLTTPSVSAIK
jgi:hypothetical protein